ncbi:MAG TPA: sulfotransferase [Oscillospiraceae bacterium]|nr:sulfotransferase [Oscillospiraceae bacterium]
MLVTIIGRGHSGTRAISETLSKSGFYMGEPLNGSWDLIPPEKMYEACRVFGSYVKHTGGLSWDFSKVIDTTPDPVFVRLIEEYLHSVLSSKAENKGWKIPETTLCYPWILKMFPEIYCIHWVRDPRDCILSGHVTDDLNDFNIKYPETFDIREKRAISWKYQRELMKATKAPQHLLSLRFEDMVFKQDETLLKLEDFLSMPMAKIHMRTDSVGRYKTDNKTSFFDFFKEDMLECGYEI